VWRTHGHLTDADCICKHVWTHRGWAYPLATLYAGKGRDSWPQAQALNDTAGGRPPLLLLLLSSSEKKKRRPGASVRRLAVTSARRPVATSAGYMIATDDFATAQLIHGTGIHHKWPARGNADTYDPPRSDAEHLSIEAWTDRLAA
jgi:hypothetical protein